MTGVQTCALPIYNFITKLNYENYSNALKLLKLTHGIYFAIVAIDFRDFSELFLRTLA